MPKSSKPRHYLIPVDGGKLVFAHSAHNAIKFFVLMLVERLKLVTRVADDADVERLKAQGVEVFNAAPESLPRKNVRGKGYKAGAGN